MPTPPKPETKPSAEAAAVAGDPKDFDIAFPDPSKKPPPPAPGAEQNPEPANDDRVTSVDETGRETTMSARDRERAHDLIDSKNGVDIGAEFSALNPIRFDNEEMGMLAGLFRDEKSGSEFEISYTDGYTLSPVACVSTPETGTHFQMDHKLEVKSESRGYAMILVNGKWMLRVAYGFAGPQRLLVGKLYEARGSGWNFARDIEAYEIARKAELDKCRPRRP